jgi:hypothetical protein
MGLQVSSYDSSTYFMWSQLSETQCNLSISIFQEMVLLITFLYTNLQTFNRAKQLYFWAKHIKSIQTSTVLGSCLEDSILFEMPKGDILTVVKTYML